MIKVARSLVTGDFLAHCRHTVDAAKVEALGQTRSPLRSNAGGRPTFEAAGISQCDPPKMMQLEDILTKISFGSFSLSKKRKLIM